MPAKQKVQGRSRAATSTRKPTFDELTHRLGMARFRLAHPEKYVVSGEYTPAQRKDLEAQIRALRKARSEVRAVKRGPDAGAAKKEKVAA
jgi:hypothetical protein